MLVQGQFSQNMAFCLCLLDVLGLQGIVYATTSPTVY